MNDPSVFLVKYSNSDKKNLKKVALSDNFPIFAFMDRNEKHRTITFYKDYFETFLSVQRQKVKDKIIWTLKLIEEVDRVPETYLKHLAGKDGLYEVRVQIGSDIFRIFCFFDEGNLVVLANGFQKRHRKHLKMK